MLENVIAQTVAKIIIAICAVGMTVLIGVAIYGVYAEIYHLVYKMKRGL